MTELEMSKIGENMRRARRSKRITLWELSKVADITESTIRNIEAGRSRANLTTVIYLADALGLSIDEYIGRTAPTTPTRWLDAQKEAP